MEQVGWVIGKRCLVCSQEENATHKPYREEEERREGGERACTKEPKTINITENMLLNCYTDKKLLIKLSLAFHNY